jgi:outer membrane protein insertion porin family
VEVVGVSEELKRIAYDALTSRPNFAYTLKEVQADLKRVFATGWFSSCVPDAEDTRDGVKLVIKVRAWRVSCTVLAVDLKIVALLQMHSAEQ